jgi:hypothetical protein
MFTSADGSRSLATWPGNGVASPYADDRDRRQARELAHGAQILTCCHAPMVAGRASLARCQASGARE